MQSHLPWLDGLRGLAALWVLVSHAQILSGMPGVPVLSCGELAVDLFMLLSGFLMAHHYALRQADEPWHKPATFFVFWIRRFFRIAPLYYLLLAAALLLGPWLGEWRDAIAQHWPHTATEQARYTDRSLANILAHVSFIFGAMPEHAFRTPLPDWSIGLEMSFYAAFPFLMLAIGRWGSLRAGLAVVALAGAAQLAFPQFFTQFTMPAFLPIKLYLFVIGIWMALSRLHGGEKRILAGIFLVLLALVVLERSEIALARVALVTGMFALLHAPETGMLDQARHMLASRAAVWLGETSYGVYLLHLLILTPVAGALSRIPEYLALPAPLRFALCITLAAPPSYLIAWGLYRTIEAGGIRLGKQMIGRLKLAARRPTPAGRVQPRSV
jgi:peptidoglycan/LPS O-acetylase OafA/YrhL